MIKKLDLKFHHYIFIISISFLLFSCDKTTTPPPAEEDEVNYSFLVAGHIYGKPEATNLGFHPPFKDYFSYIKEIENIHYAIYTGDIVRSPYIEEQWDATIADMEDLNIDYHVAAGNHDRGTEFLERFGMYYYSFREGDELFIILNTNQWRIEGDQKDFLISTLNDNEDVSTIFMFMHELIWWSPDSIFQNIGINFLPHYPGSTNYWEEISPILESTDKDVYLFSGDVGATQSSSPYAYYNYNKIHFVASGMGYGIDDNYLIVDIYDDGRVKINLKALQGESDRLGDITLYELP